MAGRSPRREAESKPAGRIRWPGSRWSHADLGRLDHAAGQRIVEAGWDGPGRSDALRSTPAPGVDSGLDAALRSVVHRTHSARRPPNLLGGGAGHLFVSRSDGTGIPPSVFPSDGNEYARRRVRPHPNTPPGVRHSRKGATVEGREPTGICTGLGEPCLLKEGSETPLMPLPEPGGREARCAPGSVRPVPDPAQCGPFPGDRREAATFVTWTERWARATLSSELRIDRAPTAPARRNRGAARQGRKPTHK